MELFYTMLLKNGVPVYYNVSKEGNCVTWQPATDKNNIKELPVFTLKHEGHEWVAETIDHEIFDDHDLISQAVEDLKGYYFNK